jgi:selenocysteine-specific elongation factor
VIVATAGHVDHGKTSLVRALTGEDTDRLPEEKRRGMSIDLGFAYLPSANGARIAFVDVPGHERFVRNMTAGVQGIDLALLVVAADDGPMPQTREHLQILDRLGAPTLLAVMSKVDRVSPERAAEAVLETAAVLAQTRFAGAEILPLSPITGEGMPELRARLEAIAAGVAPRRSAQRFRMHVDRAFVIDGLGLTVTGSVLSGAIAAGDEIQLLPRGLRARVRSLRADSGEAQRALAGQRCALALHGLARGDAERGDTVVDAAPAPVSRHLDVALDPLSGAKLKDGAVTVHLGTAQHAAKLRRFGAFARLAFATDVCALAGDRLLLRDPGSQKLVASATVLDPMPPERGAAKPQRLEVLQALAGRAADNAFDALLDAGLRMVDAAWFCAAYHLPETELHRIEQSRSLAAFQQRGARHLMRKAAWDAQCQALEAAITDWHRVHPDAVGPKPAEAGAPLAGVVNALVEQGKLVRDGACLRRPGHVPVLSREDEALWQRFAPLLPGEGLRAPRVHELSALLSMEPKAVADFLNRAARAGRVHRVASNRYFLPGTIGKLVALAAELAAEHPEGFPARVFRDRSELGRNLTIEVLEYLDQAGYTRRAGDLRRMRSPT